MENRRLKMGMVGGGITGFIGAIHLRAALMENMVELVCGCFSSKPEVSKESGRTYFLPDNRIYNTYQEMFEKEMNLPENERMDFVAIVTPNKYHFEPAMMALERGFHVVLDKPMTFSLEEAKALQKKVEETGLVLALTHVYSGYPAVKEMKARIAAGELGKLRRVYVEYPQGWLAERIEAFSNIYRNFTLTVMDKMKGDEPTAEMLDFPNVYDGVRGMQFIETVVKSGWSDSPKWVKWVE